MSIPRPVPPAIEPQLIAPDPGAGTVEDVAVMAATVTQTVQLRKPPGDCLPTNWTIP